MSCSSDFLGPDGPAYRPMRHPSIKQPSYQTRYDVEYPDKGDFDDATTSGTSTPRFTPGTTVYAPSDAGSSEGDGGSHITGHHCSTCTCIPPVDDTISFKDARGQPYNRAQIQLAAVTARDGFLKARTDDETIKQMKNIKQILKKLDLPYTRHLYHESPLYPFATPGERDTQITRLITDDGFLETTEEAYKWSCKPNTDEPKKWMDNVHTKLKMAREGDLATRQ